MGPALPLTINVPEHGSRRLIKELHAQLRSAIIDGRLKPGLKLPSSRSLAQEWRVSRNCVVAVYDLLLSEGYIRALPRGGTYVADTAPRPTERGKALPLDNLQSPLARHWRSKPRIFRFEPSSGFEFDFGVGVPDTSVFPFDWWRRLSARALRAFSRAPGGYAEPEGRQSLREAIARHVSLTRAVACNADDVVVTSGAQQAFDLLARVLVTPGKTVVALEDPGYPPMREAFLTCGAKLAPVPVDSEGIVVERIPHGARIVCVTPSHQFPMGCVMSARRRAALLDFARRRRAVVIEDDYDGEFSHTGRPLDALKTLDTAHCVFYVGTFSSACFRPCDWDSSSSRPGRARQSSPRNNAATGTVRCFPRTRSRRSWPKGISRATFARCGAFIVNAATCCSMRSGNYPASTCCPPKLDCT